MDQKIEIERMQAAFNRAAEKALHGTREERSGRFQIRQGTVPSTRKKKQLSNSQNATVSNK